MDAAASLCKLCQCQGDLEESHVIPAFVGKYLKNTSATGYLMAVDVEGRPTRSQDLYKTQLLCRRCEGILSACEAFFANAIFHPFQKNALVTVPRDDRLARFAVSVSLRSLWVLRLAQHPLVTMWEQKLGELESEWRDYLLDAPHFRKGLNSHHILLCDENLLAKGLRASPNLIHSVMRSSAYYLFEKFGKTYIFANLAGVHVISMIFPEELPVSQGTEVYPKQTFGSVIPPGIGWGGYYQNLLELAKQLDAARSRQTVGQKARVDQAMTSDPSKVASSEDVRILLKQRQIRHDSQKENEAK